MDVKAARQIALDARNEAREQPTDQALSDFNAYYIARPEAALREAAQRCDDRGDHVMAMEFMGLFYDLKAMHAKATALALKAGVEVGVRSGER